MAAAHRLLMLLPNTYASTLQSRAAKTYTALVVEDNTVSAKLITKMLAAFGCDADRCTTGAEALDRLARLPYSLVFLDVDLPDRSGLDVMRVLRQLAAQDTASASNSSGGTRMPFVVATTGHLFTERNKPLSVTAAVAYYEQQGFDRVLTKPFTMEQLRDTLEACEQQRACLGDA